MLRKGIRADNRIMIILGAFGDVIIVNFFTILLCLPIITAGASLTAGCTCFFQMESSEQHAMFRVFFQAFRKNFKQATQAWLIILVGLVLGGGDLIYTLFVAESVGVFYLIFALVVLFVFISMAMWVFPLIARYENTLGEQIKNAFYLSMGRMPRTLLIWLLWGGPIVLSYFYGPILVICAFLWVTVLIALQIWATVRIVHPVFKRISE